MKPRLNVYIDDDLNERLDALAAKPGSSKSAIVSDALKHYLARGAVAEIDAVLKARLDKVARHLARLERDQQVVLETLALFIRFELTVTAPLPDGDQLAAKALGTERFNSFVDQVGRRIAGGKSLTRDVLERVTADAVIEHNGELQEVRE
jgi:predicted transcriptional regulator